MTDDETQGLRVMLASDDSESARVAEAWVARLRWASPAMVDVVTIASRGLSRLGWSMEGDRQVVRQAIDSMRRAELAAAERVANEVGERLQGVGLTVHTWARQGETREELLRLVDELRPDVVVLGPRGRSVVASMLLGSVTQDLVEYSPSPVLVTRPPRETDDRLPSHVLVLADGSRPADDAVAWLDRAGWLVDARLTLLGLLGERAGLERGEPTGATEASDEDDVARLVREEAVAMLERIGQPLLDRGLLVDVALIEGHPLQAASDEAVARGADLIVVSRTPRRPWSDAFSQKVTRHAPVSVLVVPAPEP
jgi:nucleotide-binding universal stress UspA family protein